MRIALPVSTAAGLAIIAFYAGVTALILFYVVGVLISFPLSQNGMVRHWARLLHTEADPSAPQRVLGRCWDQLLHNQSALRRKGMLLSMPGVMVTSVPWQLNSSERLKALQPSVASADACRGIFG